MKLFLAGCVFIGYFVHVLLANQKGCSFSVHGKIEQKSPILLQNDSSLILPSKGKIHLKNREIITLLCPDSNNYLIGIQSNATYAQCIRGKTLRVGNRDVNFHDLQCKHTIRGMVSKTTKKYGNNQGRIYRIGYQLSSRHFITLIAVCYDSNIDSVLYTEHFLHGQDVRHASKSSYRPSFRTEAAAVAVSVAYKQAFQKSTFNKLLRSSRLAQVYINDNSFLVRGQLSPDADFLFAATQYISYYYINTVPQWQAISEGNWRRIEAMVRKVADYLQETLIIITGTHQVLTLPDYNGDEREIYLIADRKLPVPKFIWKAVYSKKSKKAVVLVSLNNPFTPGIGKNDFLCESICDQVGWGSLSWADYERGFVHCCDYGEFAAEVGTAPKLAVVGVLHGPK
ncbi:Endonuclease NS domain containing protein [Asbolus verrucosus]|uniref:Endonuclease NS domain containing protein n=1 Tax=Asbolus verrucosus TaxID=1661398 RepID=A0A482W3B6_ASBVE|nr:Endonuclease NS domain containing protein [Asbolus verrucosus]